MKAYIRKMGEFNESSTCIEKVIYSPAYTIYPSKGDLYLRLRRTPPNNAIFVFKFNGKSNKFYDQNFGAGEEYHYGNHVDFKDFVKWVESLKNKDEMIDWFNRKMIEVEGMPIWTPAKIESYE